MTQHRTTSAATILRKAERGRYAIGAFNVSDLLTLKAVENAATKLHAPVIIETSPGETAFVGMENLVTLLAGSSRRTGLPFLANLDHATTRKDVLAALNAGFAMLHFDGSALPASRNIRILKTIVPNAHRKGRLVEGELDHITGKGSERQRGRMEREQAKGRYTNPEKVHAFVRATHVDILASFIGNVHGVFDNRERLDLALLRRIRAAVPCWLSLHGGSGISDRDVRAAIRCGIVKVNVNTELRMAYIDAMRKALRNKKEIAPYKLFPPVVSAVQKVVEAKIRLFGSAGKG